jgi:RNA polymerase sigma-70 factor (TIGR02960 family)
VQHNTQGLGPSLPVEDRFASFAEQSRGELLVHCYRMTGSFIDAEELVQETFLRAWRHRDRFEERASMRTWLYRIATNACLDWLEQGARRVMPVGLAGSPVERVPWLQPIPDDILDRVTSSAEDPLATAVARETIELAMLAALQLLPPRQRAVFIARDIVGLSPLEVAGLLDTTVEAVNSLVQRARSTMRSDRHAVSTRGGGSETVTDAERDLLARYVDAHERSDIAAMTALLSDSIVMTMPPEPSANGADAAHDVLIDLFRPDITGEWRLAPVYANRRPATANYLRRPGDPVFRALSIDVLRAEDGRIIEINCFLGEAMFEHFGLPLTYHPSTHHAPSHAGVDPPSRSEPPR